jgi:hypothetical protein
MRSMKRLWLVAFLILPTSTNVYSQIRIKCPAPEFKPPSRQYRGVLKHRARGGETGTSITIAEIYALPDVPTELVNSDANNDRPMPGSAEQQTFTLEASLRQAKVEGNDCEIHLEFSETARKNAHRVIVEIPPDSDFASDYQKILRLMRSRFPRRRKLGPGVAFGLLPAVRMKVTGFGFFDGVHKAMAGPNRPNGGHGSAQVKTFWELHPGWNIQCSPATACP